MHNFVRIVVASSICLTGSTAFAQGLVGPMEEKDRYYGLLKVGAVSGEHSSTLSFEFSEFGEAILTAKGLEWSDKKLEGITTAAEFGMLLDHGVRIGFEASITDLDATSNFILSSDLFDGSSKGEVESDIQELSGMLVVGVDFNVSGFTLTPSLAGGMTARETNSSAKLLDEEAPGSYQGLDLASSEKTYWDYRLSLGGAYEVSDGVFLAAEYSFKGDKEVEPATYEFEEAEVKSTVSLTHDIGATHTVSLGMRVSF